MVVLPRDRSGVAFLADGRTGARVVRALTVGDGGVWRVSSVRSGTNGGGPLYDGS